MHSCDPTAPYCRLLGPGHQQIQGIDVGRPAKRPRAGTQGLVRPPTPFPRSSVDRPRSLTPGGESGATTTSATATMISDSPASSPTDCSISRTQYMPPPQLSEVIDALTCLQENISVLSSKPGGPTSHEVTDLAMKPCECIVRDLRAVMATHAAGVRRAEQHARARLGAEIIAFLHVSE